jgi:hypothetical protein
MELDKINNTEIDPEVEFNARLKKLMDADKGITLEDEADAPETEQGLKAVDVSEDVEEEEEIDDDHKSAGKLNKDQAAIVALRRKLKEKEEELRLEKSQKAINEEANQKKDLLKYYEQQGYSDEEAKRMAESDLTLRELKQRVAVTEFKAENAELFTQYPDARTQIDRILQVMTQTGFTAEQVCRAMFYNSNPAQERAEAAVTGKLNSKPADNTVSSATRSGITPQSASLSQTDRKTKAEFEAHYGAISNERFLELKEKYNL